ncbi:MAG: hypothetical protein ACPHUL_10545 [Marinomonas gallaica]
MRRGRPTRAVMRRGRAGLRRLFPAGFVVGLEGRGATAPTAVAVGRAGRPDGRTGLPGGRAGLGVGRIGRDGLGLGITADFETLGLPPPDGKTGFSLGITVGLLNVGSFGVCGVPPLVGFLGSATRPVPTLNEPSE